MFLLAEQISVEETDQSVETDEDHQVDPRGLVHAAPPHEEQAEESSELSSVEDMLDIGNSHLILARVRSPLLDGSVSALVWSGLDCTS